MDITPYNVLKRTLMLHILRPYNLKIIWPELPKVGLPTETLANKIIPALAPLIEPDKLVNLLTHANRKWGVCYLTIGAAAEIILRSATLDRLPHLNKMPQLLPELITSIEAYDNLMSDLLGRVKLTEHQAVTLGLQRALRAFTSAERDLLALLDYGKLGTVNMARLKDEWNTLGESSHPIPSEKIRHERIFQPDSKWYGRTDWSRTSTLRVKPHPFMEFGERIRDIHGYLDGVNDHLELLAMHPNIPAFLADAHYYLSGHRLEDEMVDYYRFATKRYTLNNHSGRALIIMDMSGSTSGNLSTDFRISKSNQMFLLTRALLHAFPQATIVTSGGQDTGSVLKMASIPPAIFADECLHDLLYYIIARNDQYLRDTHKGFYGSGGIFLAKSLKRVKLEWRDDLPDTIIVLMDGDNDRHPIMSHERIAEHQYHVHIREPSIRAYISPSGVQTIETDDTDRVVRYIVADNGGLL